MQYNATMKLTMLKNLNKISYKKVFQDISEGFKDGFDEGFHCSKAVVGGGTLGAVAGLSLAWTMLGSTLATGTVADVATGAGLAVVGGTFGGAIGATVVGGAAGLAKGCVRAVRYGCREIKNQQTQIELESTK